LFYFIALTGLLVLRFAIVRITALARISVQRICLIGTGAHISGFIQHYEPWALGLNVVGCRFPTPVAVTASVEIHRAALDRDLAEAVASVRSLEPDAIYLLLPWSATETIQRCAETFQTLPVEIHLGPK
jgi:CoA-binding domain